MISSITKKARICAGKDRNYPQAENNENHLNNDADEGKTNEEIGACKMAADLSLCMERRSFWRHFWTRWVLGGLLLRELV